MSSNAKEKQLQLRHLVSNEPTKSLEALLEINDLDLLKDLFKGLWVGKMATQLSNTQSVPKKREKWRVFIAKSTFFRRISFAFLASGLVIL